MRELPTPRPTFVLARGAYDAPTEPVTPGTPKAILPFDGKSAAQPSRPRAVAAVAGQSADGTRLRQSLLGDGVRSRPGAHCRGLRQPGADAEPSRAARLAGHDVREVRLECQGAAEADRDVGDLPSVVARRRAGARRRPREHLARRAGRHSGCRSSRCATRRWPRAACSCVASAGRACTRTSRPASGSRSPPARKYPQSTGEGLYRRSLYTAWKRAAPPPSAIGFDASERLTCIVTRQRTNTPQQALILLNDPQFVESARVLAEQLMRDGATPADRVTLAFRRVITRGAVRVRGDAAHPPRTRRRAPALRPHPQSAVALLATGERPRDPALDPTELAAWTIVASTIMNLDEAVFSR